MSSYTLTLWASPANLAPLVLPSGSPNLPLQELDWNARPGLACSRNPPETLTSTTNTEALADLQTLGSSKQFYIADPANLQPTHNPSAVLYPADKLDPKSHSHQARRRCCHVMG